MAALLAALFGLAALQDKKPDPAAELASLIREQEEAENAFWGSLRSAKGEEERRRLLQDRPQPKFLAKFQDLARRAEGTEAAAGALKQVLLLGFQVGEPETSRKAVDALMTAHLRSPVLEEVAGYLGGDPGKERGRAHLRRMMEESPHAAVRAAARFNLGCSLLRDGAAEGRKLLEDLKKSDPDSPYAKRAEGTIFELEHLKVGGTPPDFEAVDQDGTAFKLSDYRGKVVVLDFWGYW